VFVCCIIANDDDDADGGGGDGSDVGYCIGLHYAVTCYLA